MDFLDLLPQDLSGGRMIESMIILFIVWRKIKPHLHAIEERLKGVENAVTIGFKAGETRFKTIEDRLTVLEKKGDNHGSDDKSL